MTQGAMRRVRALVFGLLSFPAACGGGSSTSSQAPAPPMPPPIPSAMTLTGPYHMVTFVPQSAPRRVHVTWGRATPDGVSEVAMARSGNDSTVGVPPFASTQDYAVSSDGTMTLAMQNVGTELSRGGVSADGSCALLSSSESGTPSVTVLLRRAGSFDSAALTGAYGFASGGLVAVGPSASSNFRSITFDGVTGFSQSSNVNIEGSITLGGSDVGLYALTVEGLVTLTPASSNEVVRGEISEDAEIGVWGGGSGDGDLPVMSAFVRLGTGLANATLIGTYWLVGWEASPAGGFSSFAATMTANGAGGIEVSGHQTDESSDPAPFTETATYSVGATGAVTLTRGSDTIIGSVSPSGKYAVFCGATNAGGPPLIWVACRK